MGTINYMGGQLLRGTKNYIQGVYVGKDNSMRYIYADNAATTAVSESVIAAMMPYFREEYGNPSSVYRLGRNAGSAVENARAKIAEVMGCLPKEIYFTSGGTESDNLAIKGAARLKARQGKRHIITTVFEHPAVLKSCKALENEGFFVTYLPVDERGIVTAEQVSKAVCGDTALVTVMYVNNEIGTIQPIEEIAEVCREKGILFHTDAVQAVGNIPINLHETAQMLSCSGHELHAPKGIGFLYLSTGVEIQPVISGGGQERGIRSGTPNVPAIVGLAQAVEDSCKNIPEKTARLTAVRDRIIRGILENTKGSCLNGDSRLRVCNNINISFPGVSGEMLLLLLDKMGICASSGSACAAGSLDPSHVLLAMGRSREMAKGSLRLTVGEDITDEEADYIVKSVVKAVS